MSLTLLHFFLSVKFKNSDKIEIIGEYESLEYQIRRLLLFQEKKCSTRKIPISYKSSSVITEQNIFD